MRKLVSKVCNTCGVDKPLAGFKRTATRWRHQCIECRAAYHKVYRELNKERMAAQMAQWEVANYAARRKYKTEWAKAKRAEAQTEPPPSED
jgi:hypothetical protein